MNTLDLDEGFVPCPVKDGDELFANGIFEFNVTRILERIERDPANVAVVHAFVRRLRWEDLTLDEAQVEAADLARPILLAEIGPGEYNMIDGHHRVEKAFRDGVHALPAHALTVDQHVRFLTSTRAYRTYVDYWNDKVEERRGAGGLLTDHVKGA